MEVKLDLGGGNLCIKPETGFEKDFIDKYFQKKELVATRTRDEINIKFTHGKIE